MHPRHTVRWVPAALLLAVTPVAFASGVLWDNGGFVNLPTGGTGTIEGQPISQVVPYINQAGNTFGVLSVNATFASGTKVAEDFTVPAGPGWDLSTVTFFAFQTGQSTPVVSTIYINLWTATPYTADSPDLPPGTPIPSPVLSQPLPLTHIATEFIAYRVSAGASNLNQSNRPVFAYTVSLDGLPNGGVLEPGTYWIEWSMAGAGTGQVGIPPVTPYELAPNHNARQFTRPLASLPISWFEPREGYQVIQGVEYPGRPYALPFVLNGSVVPEPAAAGLLLPIAMLGLARRRR